MTEQSQKDRFPRVFIVCGVISFILIWVVLGAILFDMMRTKDAPLRPAPVVVESEAPSGGQG